MHNKRRIPGALLAVLMFVIASTTSFAGDKQTNVAKEGGIITPYWVGVSNVDYNLTCSEGKANPQIKVEVDAGKTDKVNFKGSLLQYKDSKWTTIASWNADKQISLGRCSFNESYSITKGYDYKFVTIVKAYKGSTLVDTINVDSKVVKY